MASLKEVRSRITSVSSTQQITKAMKMVAASKLRRAQDGIMRMRPYAQRLGGILANLSTLAEGPVSNKYAEERDANRILIVTITSDRGLAGAFNSNVIKAATMLVTEKYATQMAAGNVSFLTIGKKGFEAFSKRGYTVNGTYTGILGQLSFDAVRGAAEFAMDGFINKQYDRVEIVYNEFRNVATQIIRTEQFLPILENQTDENTSTAIIPDYTFEPSKEEIILELIPKSLKVQFYKAILESRASEEGARMTAMEKATENAGELLKQLKLTYNRTRQAAITTEILEIVGGAEALAAK